jgi:hypothetical protein
MSNFEKYLSVVSDKWWASYRSAMEIATTSVTSAQKDSSSQKPAIDPDEDSLEDMELDL